MTPRKKTEEEEIEWLGVPEILKILEQVNGRPIHPRYLPLLAKQNRIARKQIDGRTYLYSKQDAEKTHIIERKGAGRRKREETSEDLPTAA